MDLHFGDPSQLAAIVGNSYTGCMDLHFGDPSQLLPVYALTAGRCMDLHFGDPSQHKERTDRMLAELHGPPFRRPFTTGSVVTFHQCELHGPPFRRPFTTKHADIPYVFLLHGPPFRRPFTTVAQEREGRAGCMDLHFGDPSQPIDLFLPIKPNVYRAKRPYTTA